MIFVFVWLTSLSMIISRSIHVAANGIFYSFYGWVIFHCTYIPHFLYPFICWWTFRLLMLLWTLGCIFLFKLEFSPDICPGMGLLDHMVNLVFFFKWAQFFLECLEEKIYNYEKWKTTISSHKEGNCIFQKDRKAMSNSV